MRENRQNNQRKQGFSITEMSVVIAIITILLGTILASRGIIRNFRLENAKRLTNNSPVTDIYNTRGEQSVKMWFDATNQNNVEFSSTTASTISAWYDISGNGNHATQTSSSLYPTYVSDGINNLPAIEFAVGGSTKYLEGKGGLTMYDDTYSIAMVWVTQEVGGSDTNTIFYIGNDPFTSGAYISLRLDDGDLRFAAGGNPGKTLLFSSLTANTPYATVVVKNDAEMSSWNNHDTNYDATAVTNTHTNAITEKLRIGDSIKDADTEFDGYIGELIIFDKALSDAEAENILDYLGKKWQIRTN